MIENKGIGSKIFDVINVVILVLITLICILPVWYVLCVSLSSREAVNAGQVALWPVGFNLLSYQKILGESDFFGSFLVSVKRVVLGTGVSMVCILLAAYPLSRTKKQFPKRDIFMWIFVFCMLFNGGTVPWYVTMKNYGLMDSIWGLVLGMGLQVFNVILAVNFFRSCLVNGRKRGLWTAAAHGGSCFPATFLGQSRWLRRSPSSRSFSTGMSSSREWC